MTWQDKYRAALAHHDAGRLDAAERSYRAAIAANPGFGEAHHNLGVVLHLRGRYRQAIHAFETSRKLDPDLTAAARTGVGAILLETGEYANAEQELRAAVAADPNFINAHRFLGDLLRAQGRMDEARTEYREGARCDPRDAESRFGLAFTRLALGDMPGGWDDYEWRLSRLRTPALQPVWNGEEIAGRTLLVHSEQGLGDAIQFLRYVPLLAQRGARVLLAIRQEIAAIGATVGGYAELVEPTYTLPRFDFSIGLPSLPRLFRTTLETIPRDVPYLRADPARVTAWREKLGEWDGPTVAIAWRGNPSHRNDHRRSMRNGEIAPLFDVPGVRFLILQQDDADAPNGANILRLGEHGFDDVAALMEVADVTISVDTVFCHLAGALGRPAWTMLCVGPDWRWQTEGESTPWYPTMRLFRQNTTGDWTRLVSNVARALQTLRDSR
ncbi:MAG TPA: tetratricopeptide repeat-containing glycosyltransferase family protein [Rhizomicrobium sp.]|jgi:thioredoxin-like negative regulator of GroEL